MKKTIRKPENWQDFESLCKKLWGEIWEIPMKIKKNGRNGQPQAGVDVYGVPKDEVNYWGIQCKGKDEYANAKLTKKEIEEEIEKATKFKPSLAVFIFATTMNKDSKIEEYVRIKDLENRKNGKFEILLYCWEDIADLIEENRDTFNYYVNNKQHKTKYDFSVYLDDFDLEHTIHPKCVRKIKRYKVKEPKIEREELDLGIGLAGILNNPLLMNNYQTFNSSSFKLMTEGKVNEAICSFEIIMANTGSMVIEDWRVKVKFTGELEEILDVLGTGPMGMPDITKLQYKRTYVDGDTISYSPKDNEPLIQKDNRYYEAYVIPKCKEYRIPIQWELLARDYDASGELFIIVKPEYEDEIIYEEVESIDDLKEDEIISIKAKKNYSDEEENNA